MTHLVANRPSALISACLIALLTGLAVGCGSEPDAGQSAQDGAAQSDPAQVDPASGDPAPGDPADPAADGATTAAAPDSGATPAPGTANLQGKDVLCSTPSQTGQITWQEGEPRLSMTRKPNQPVLNQASPVAIQRNDDSSVTYGFLQNPTAYIKTFPDGNCMVQILDAQGSVTVEEYGRTN
ncbi:MAG: hypothetical protein AAF289_02695 [Cyanobacteria bacterium P01_A01_bin.135]